LKEMEEHASEMAIMLTEFHCSDSNPEGWLQGDLKSYLDCIKGVDRTGIRLLLDESDAFWNKRLEEIRS
jgi:hypothetical protein